MSGELQVLNLGKSYRRWGGELRRMASWFVPTIAPREERWVLRHVNFEVRAGEAIGIIGQNGAGKSTLLKMITGTVQPTEGAVHMRGRVAAILELGMGFNSDMSGRDNVYHSAGLMGYSWSEIERAMPAIEAFAEIGAYFDQPMRTYSSGMQMRVAFSVATAFRPDLLIVDEALSVGDSYFQHKSFDRIRQFRDEGVSIIFVSHSLSDVRTLCDRVILMDKGQVLKDGAPDEVVDYYNAMVTEKENAKLTVEQRREKNGWLMTRSGSGEARVADLRLVDAASGAELAVVNVGQQVELRLDVSVRQDLPRLVLGYMIRDKQGHVIWGSNTWHTEQVAEAPRAGETIRFRLPFTCTLGPGSYSVSPALVSSDTHLADNYEWVDNLLVFDVVNTGRHFFIGSNSLDARFVIEREREETN
ncbi:MULTISPECIES: ABC transporter ATP-binding protein [unclassified Massilia]|uniref:ABC transporter ATP-binding protein n=1 Tax=unclassified Massilia TaxID=2609279 RepID=UPI001783D545|nr:MULTISPECIES: ABC transporter ATP-binding protein [unclassified Massilia]MBD8529899.1 ABC transporter ATP-binding protein [Massilia sp. CFBP 13647]MBD8672089.1 ABC transporter ATP-binding protein [Massilia sp. CFBP 13721]